MAMNRRFGLFFSFAMALLLIVCGCAPGKVEAAIEPGHEIKFNLKPERFTESQIKEVFSAVKKDEVKIYYFDTSDKKFATADYNHRLRVYKGKKKLDVTYKKAIKDKSVTDAIQIAEQHGFTGKEDNYKFELDRKGGHNTFTISRKDKLKVSSSVSFDAFNSEDARQIMIKNAPDKIAGWDNKDWYQNTLASSIVFGPAEAITYEGSYLGHDADIEVWNHKGAQMIEISAKEDDAMKAAQIEELWLKQLQSDNNLSADQRGKTSFVMD